MRHVTQTPESPVPVTAADELGERLDGWVAAGLIRPDQAEKILAAEAAAGNRGPSAERPGRRTPYVVEALGYLGATLATIAGFLAVDRLWPDIPLGAQLAFAASGTVLLAAAAMLIGTPREPAIGRLRSVLLALSTCCFAAFTALLVGEVVEVGSAGTTLTTTAATTAYAAGWWWRARTPLQHLTTYVAAAFTAGAAVNMVDTTVDIWWIGTAIWGLSALWIVLAYRGLLRPRDIGILGPAVGLLVSAQMTMEVAAGHVLALATVAGLLAAGVAGRRLPLLALGAVGVAIVVPQTAARYLPASAAAPLAVFVVGVMLLGVALWLARSQRIRRRNAPTVPDESGRSALRHQPASPHS
jgi:hypothetical protein